MTSPVGGFPISWRLAAVAALALAAPALALAASRAGEALAKLERGRWAVRSASPGAVDRELCLQDPGLLFQIEHGAKGCSQQLTQQGENRATVEYVCPGRGFGHTSVRMETSRTATIETQGFVEGRPFAYRASARKLGEC
jgi:hypothetical protein